MAKIRLTKHYDFEMAHALYHYNGRCKNIHGHSYHLYVTVIGEPIEDMENPKNGMVLDFSDLKKIVKQEIVDNLDHSIMLNAKAQTNSLNSLTDMYERHHLVNFQPTCENLVVYIADQIIPKLPKGVRLHSVRLYETSDSYAEWFASDNE